MLNLKRYWLFFSIPSILIAQSTDIKFEHYSIDEGLSQTQVNCIIQDKEGFLWICTFDGLNKFDGYNFTVYYHDPFDSNSISSNDINCIYEDKKGVLWIGTYDNGVDILDKTTNKFRHLNYSLGNSDDLNYKNIWTINEDNDGIIWMGTQGGGLIKYDRYKNKFMHFKNDSNDPYSLSDNTVYAIIEDQQQTLWIGTKDGLNILDRATNKFFNYKNDKGLFLQQRENYISILYLDKQNNLWVGANHYLARFDRLKNKFQNFDITFKGDTDAQGYRFWSIFKDISGTLWMGTTRGLQKFDEKQNQFSFYCNNPSDPHSLSNNYVWTGIQDFSGNIWIGTDIGINKFNLENTKFLQVGGKKMGGPLERLTYVWAIYEDNKGIIWIGTETGLFRWNRKTNECIEYNHSPKDKNSICNNLIYSIAGDSKDNIWIATVNGLDRYDYNGDKFFHYTDTPGWKKYIADNVIYKIFIDHKGIVWFGVGKVGLVQYNPETQKFSNFNSNSIVENNKYLATAIRFFEDSEHNVWISSENGLIKYIRDNNKFIAYRHDPYNPNTISSNKIMSIFEDHAGNMWIGTDGNGLNYFDKNKQIFKCYLRRDGFPSNTIYGILEDAKGNLWLSSNNGLSKYNPDNMSITNFDVSDGLQSKEFNAGAYFKNNKGEMFFGGINGMNVFHPDSIKYNTHIPQVVITEIKIMNKQIPEASILSAGILEVSYSQNFISFQFAALDFTSPNKNQYKYKMEGFDKEWIYAGSKRFVDYTNLDPGEYTFKVIASNNDGVWNRTGTSLSIIVHPPYWMTWWFRFLAIGFLGLIAAYAYQRRINNLKKGTIAQQKFSQQLIDSQENERKRMASELHDGLGQNLLIINNRAKMALKKPDFDTAKTQIESISEIALESINDVRKIAYNLHPYHLDELGLTKTIQSIIGKSFETTDIRISQSVDFIDSIFKPEAEINIFRIIQEGINNIIKHSAAKNAIITIINEDEQIKIKLIDDGNGMSKEFIGNCLKSSVGFGLKGMYERARLLSGNLQIGSGEEKGTTLLITIPKVWKDE
ncbi:MAG: two-component regulator propeller domain-containing protein [bacterium]